MRIVLTIAAVAAVRFVAAVPCYGQQEILPPPLETDSKPSPLLSGGLAFVPTWEAGSPTLVSIASPVLLVPLGSKFLFESRAEFEGDFERRNGTSGDFTGAVEKSLEYAQLDYIGNRYVSVSLGRFLTPFNLYNERLYPNWIRNTQSDPLIFPIGTGSDNGIMLRGGVALNRDLTLNYSAYVSALSTIDHFESERKAGMRTSVFLPRQRLELGGSFQRQLQDSRFDRFGLHLQWQPRRAPLDLRAEGTYSHAEGNGMWIEGSYRFSRASISPLRRMQAVVRTQVFHTGTMVGINEDLPVIDTERTEAGVNYYLSDNWKALASYGRTFTAAGNSDLWTVGMAYRFVIPLGPMQ